MGGFLLLRKNERLLIFLKKKKRQEWDRTSKERQHSVPFLPLRCATTRTFRLWSMVHSRGDLS
jgi:hypothetical protein